MKLQPYLKWLLLLWWLEEALIYTMVEMGKGGEHNGNGNPVISWDKGKVTLLPNIAPPFLYQIDHQRVYRFSG